MTLHLVKLCVGAASIEELRSYQAKRVQPQHVTRMMPTRRDEVLAGGSLYWVIGGEIRVRQHLLDLERITDSEGQSRCRILLDRVLIATRPWPRRPFQGWRYLDSSSAPPDLTVSSVDGLPPSLQSDLAALGLL